MVYLNPVVWYQWIYAQVEAALTWVKNLFLSQEELDRLQAEAAVKAAAEKDKEAAATFLKNQRKVAELNKEAADLSEQAGLLQAADE